MKVPSYIMRHRELMMNTNHNNEGATSDNEHMRVSILELIYKWLLISDSEYSKPASPIVNRTFHSISLPALFVLGDRSHSE